MTADYEVAVIGAGPCGLLTALLLARRHVRVAVFERRAEPLRHPKAMAISRRTAEIFQQLGVRAPMAAGGLTADNYALAIWAESLVGAEYGRVPWRRDDPRTTPYPGFHCPQTTTEAELRRALEAEDDASILFDHEILEMEAAEVGMTLCVRRGGTAEPLTFSARYVVAADGAGSPTRHALGIAAEGPGDLGHFLNVFFRAPYGPHLAGRRAVLQQLLTPESFEVFVAVNGDDLWLMHHFLQPGEAPADFSTERLAAIVRQASGLPDVPVEVLSVSPWVMSPKVAAAFRQGSVFLTGDAAARLSPAGGLGMNTGLQSAHNLAWKLAAVLRGDAPDRLLDSYDVERRSHIERTFALSNDFGAEIMEILSAGFAGDFDRVRDLVANSRRSGGGLGLDLGFRYERGAFVPGPDDADPAPDADHYAPTGAPGARFPHFPQLDGTSVLDLFGAGFVLLVAGDDAPWRAAAPADLTVLSLAEAEFPALTGIAQNGAVLVRPDGVIGWRGRDPAAVPAVLKAILAGGP